MGCSDVREAPTNAVYSVDTDFKLQYVSESLVQITGYSMLELEGVSWDFLHGKNTDIDAVKRIRDGMLDGGGAINETLLYYTKHGESSFWARLSMHPYNPHTDHSSSPSFMVSFSVITTPEAMLRNHRGNMKTQRISPLICYVPHHELNTKQPVCREFGTFKAW